MHKHLKSVEKRECKSCKKLFDAKKSSTQEACSMQCSGWLRNKHKDLQVICHICATHFQPARKGINGAQVKTCAKCYGLQNVSSEVRDYKGCRETVLSLLRTKNEYTSYDDLVKLSKQRGLRGLAGSLKRHKISVSEMNQELGYTPRSSVFEETVFACLRVVFPDAIINRQQIFTTLKSRKGRALVFDFFMPELGLLIEADGKQHSDVSHKWYSKDLAFNDQDKNAWASKNNLTLLRIPYTLRYTNESIQEAILQHSVCHNATSNSNRDGLKNTDNGSISSQAPSGEGEGSETRTYDLDQIMKSHECAAV